MEVRVVDELVPFMQWILHSATDLQLKLACLLTIAIHSEKIAIRK